MLPSPTDNKTRQDTENRDKAAAEDNLASLQPWTKRTLRIQRTGTFLGQTFVLPPVTRDRSPPAAGPEEAASKRPRLSSGGCKYISSLSPGPRTPPVLARQASKPASVSGEDTAGAGSRVTWTLQILSRLAQADRPHADLTSARTLATLLAFLARLPDTEVAASKAAKILTRLSTNLHCLFPLLLGRHLTHLLLRLDQLEAACCPAPCFTQLRALLTAVTQNVTLLAETGFGEGEICHRLVHPAISRRDKQSIVISAALVVRRRKMLDNILLRHDTLDLLLDTLETGEAEAGLVEDAVYSLAQLAAYLGVAVCCARSDLEDADSAPQPRVCRRGDSAQDADLYLVCDGGEEVACSRGVVSAASPVFAAMLTGSFTESDQARVPLPHTSVAALTCLVHHLYGCQPDTCPRYEQLTADTLLELVTLSDKYLLTELNLSACHAILRHCGNPRYLPQIYRAAVQCNYPVNCAGRLVSSVITIHKEYVLNRILFSEAAP